MTIHVPSDTVITDEFGKPTSFAFAIQAQAKLSNGRYTFTLEGRLYRVNEHDARVLIRDRE
jgi:hypothetical protein